MTNPESNGNNVLDGAPESLVPDAPIVVAPGQVRGPKSGKPILEVKDLSVSFPSRRENPTLAVRDLSYSVRSGEMLGIVGESGSGKSVSSLAIMGLLPATARVTGSVMFEGKEMLGLADKKLADIRGRKMSMIFQDPLSALTPVYSIGQQISEVIRLHNDVSKQDAMTRSVDLLQMVGIPRPQERVKSFPHEFSGGMRQRVMIAMAIANDPDLIIADEPTTALDVTIQAQILDLLQRARDVTGAAIILITHDLGVVAGLADRIQVMYGGEAVESGSSDDLFYSSRMPYTLGLLGAIPRVDRAERRRLTPIEGNPPALNHLPAGCPFAPRCPMVIDICRSEEAPLVPTTDGGTHLTRCHRWTEIADRDLSAHEVFDTGEEVEDKFAGVPRSERTTVLEVDGLKKHFPLMKGAIARRQVGTVRAVDGVSFDIREGETLGLVGESGCGKTTTILEILELVKPQAGTITVLSKDVSKISSSERRAMRKNIQIVFQDPMASLDPRLPIGDSIAEPMVSFGVPLAERRKRVSDLLELVGLDRGFANRYPHEFSGGQRQRVGIARALAPEPQLVVLDEPVSALDVSIQAGVINLLDDLRAKLGLSYLFVAHDLSVIRHIADRVAVMYVGKMVELGGVHDVFERPNHPYTQALLSAIPIPNPKLERERKRIILVGDLPSPVDEARGCRFAGRCPLFQLLPESERNRCETDIPPLVSVGEDHISACHYAERAAGLGKDLTPTA